jgi:transposase
MAKAKASSLLAAAKLLPVGQPLKNWFALLTSEQQAEIREVIAAKSAGAVAANWSTLADLIVKTYGVKVQKEHVVRILTEISRGQR